MKASNQERHFEILFDANRVVQQERTYTSRTEFVEDLVVDGVITHRLVITASDSKYYEL
ncbi:hypothetical protein [Vibrio alginolyticus]|uniref:hypothetical protein n=1 Tax=Vibrio alginolyticus TaxID=663 RepID=UPI00215BEA13|nr:hypothetical protein [Vibrio alginolyticus]MCR9586574.1 hypothetical protein [Vibrio alginolyticus]